jgi:hypothetical protein
MTTTAPGLDTAAIELLAHTLREVFTAHSGGPALTTALDELGWDDVSAADPATATSLLFTEHGRALANSRLLDDIVLDTLAPALPSDEGNRAVIYCGPNYALTLGALDGFTELMAIDGSGVVRLPSADSVTTQPIRGFDYSSGWLRAQIAAEAPALSIGEVGKQAVAAARRALCAEIIGTCEAALAAATAHTTARVQYQRPLASFQAVRHRLSESHVAVESARAALAVAWSDGGDNAARLAKLRAGRAQAEVMRHAVQVFGAIGLTREHNLHRYVTRAAGLDYLLGGHAELAEEVGTALLAGADLTPMITL